MQTQPVMLNSNTTEDRAQIPGDDDFIDRLIYQATLNDEITDAHFVDCRTRLEQSDAQHLRLILRERDIHAQAMAHSLLTTQSLVDQPVNPPSVAAIEHERERE